MPKYKIVMTPVDNFSGRSQVRFGVGEHIELEAKEDPPKRPATPAEWAVKSGPAKVKNGQLTGSALVVCGDAPGTVILELRDPKNPKDVYATKRLEVVAPTGVEFEFHQTQIKYGLGFEGFSHLQPQDVSFKWVETREGASPYEGKGCFAKTEVSLKELADSYAVIHPVKGAWTPNLGGAKKNREDSVDTVMTAIGKWGSGGEFTWRIPWLYRVHGASSEHRFTTAVHHVEINSSGQMTLSKLNVKLKRQLLPSK